MELSYYWCNTTSVDVTYQSEIEHGFTFHSFVGGETPLQNERGKTVNIFDIRNNDEIVNLDISTQEKIRLLFRVGNSRSEIVKLLGVKYQVVFKATNPKYSPKRWNKVLTTRLEEERSNKVEDVEEVELPTSSK